MYVYKTINKHFTTQVHDSLNVDNKEYNEGVHGTFNVFKQFVHGSLNV